MTEHSGPYLEFQYLEGGGGRITNSRGAWIKVRPWMEEQGEWGFQMELPSPVFAC